MPADRKPAGSPTSARGRQAGGYIPPVLTEPKGGPVPTHKAEPDRRAQRQFDAELRWGVQPARHMPGKHNQQSHGHGGGLPAPGGESGHDSDGMPATIVSQSLRFARGGTATITQSPSGRPRLTIGDRSLDVESLRELDDLIVRAQYHAENNRPAYRMWTEEGVLTLRPVVPGRWVTDTGRVVDSPEAAPRNETYPHEYDMVLNERRGGDLDSEPSVRVTLAELENDILDGLEAVGAARRVETSSGPVDVFSPGKHRLTLRVLTDGGPIEVEFDKKDWKSVDKAITDSMDRREPRTADTAHGPIEIQTDNPDDLFIGPNTMLIISSGGPPEWGIVAHGDEIKRLGSAMDANGIVAGIVR